MKKLFLLSAVALMMATACSSNDDPTPDPSIDHELIDAASRGEVTLNYVCSTEEVQQSNGLNWEYESDAELGNGSVSPLKILVKDGEVIPCMDLSPAYQVVDPVTPALEAYQHATGKHFDIYVRQNAKIDTKNLKLDFYNRTFSVITFGPERMTMESVFPHAVEVNGKNVMVKRVANYRAVAYTAEKSQSDMIFNSKTDAYKAIIDLCRKQFGDQIDLREVYGATATFDTPVIDLNVLETELLN